MYVMYIYIHVLYVCMYNIYFNFTCLNMKMSNQNLFKKTFF